MDQKEFITLLGQILEVDSGNVGLTDNLADYDWDSLAVLGFISAIDNKLDVTLDAERLARALTPADLLAIVDDASKV
jgi:acyl carrier protein